jgi:hypothetical protein
MGHDLERRCERMEDGAAQAQLAAIVDSASDAIIRLDRPL